MSIHVFLAKKKSNYTMKGRIQNKFVYFYDNKKQCVSLIIKQTHISHI